MPKDVDWIWLDPDDMFLDADMSLLPYQLPGKVYRSAMPFSSMFDPAGLILDAYHAAGIDLIVMLTQETDVQRFVGWDLMKRYRSLGFDILSTPIRDFSVPERGALDEPVRQTLKAAKEGRTIVIHCHAGLGRTGMFAACLARLVFGMDGLEARAWVRQHVPHAVETGEQFRFIQSFGLSED
jgi:protein tyrosine/serine phosphatase